MALFDFFNITGKKDSFYKGGLLSYEEASRLPKGGAVDMDEQNFRALAADMIGRRHAMRGKAIYDWATKYGVDIKNFGYLLADAKLSNNALLDDILGDKYEAVKKIIEKHGKSSKKKFLNGGAFDNIYVGHAEDVTQSLEEAGCFKSMAIATPNTPMDDWALHYLNEDGGALGKKYDATSILKMTIESLEKELKEHEDKLASGVHGEQPAVNFPTMKEWAIDFTNRLRGIISEKKIELEQKESAAKLSGGGEIERDEAFAITELQKIHDYAEATSAMLKEDTKLEAWIISKIAKCEQSIADVKHSLQASYPSRFDDGGEIAEAGKVAKVALLHIGSYAKQIIKCIEDETKLEPWMKSKIAVVSNDMGVVRHFLEYDLKVGKFMGGGNPRWAEERDNGTVELADGGTPVDLASGLSDTFIAQRYFSKHSTDPHEDVKVYFGKFENGKFATIIEYNRMDRTKVENFEIKEAAISHFLNLAKEYNVPEDEITYLIKKGLFATGGVIGHIEHWNKKGVPVYYENDVNGSKFQLVRDTIPSGSKGEGKKVWDIVKNGVSVGTAPTFELGKKGIDNWFSEFAMGGDVYLDTRFVHNSWWFNGKKTKAEALDEMAKSGDFYLSGNKIKYSGKEGGEYSASHKEVAYFLERKKYWENFREQESEKELNKLVDAKELFDSKLRNSSLFDVEYAKNQLNYWKDEDKDNEVDKIKYWETTVKIRKNASELAKRLFEKQKNKIKTQRDFDNFMLSVEAALADYFKTPIRDLAIGDIKHLIGQIFYSGGDVNAPTDGANLRWLDEENVVELAEGGGLENKTPEQLLAEGYGIRADSDAEKRARYSGLSFPHKIKIRGVDKKLALSKSFVTGMNGSKEYLFIDEVGEPYTGYGFNVKEALASVEEWQNKFTDGGSVDESWGEELRGKYPIATDSLNLPNVNERWHAEGGNVDASDIADEKTRKEVDFLVSKGYTIDCYSQKESDCYFEVDGQTLVSAQGRKGLASEGTLEIGIAYFITDFEEPISKTMLRYITTEFAHGKIVLYTNAGVEVKSTEAKKTKRGLIFEDIEIVKVPLEEIEKLAEGGGLGDGKMVYKICEYNMIGKTLYTSEAMPMLEKRETQKNGREYFVYKGTNKEYPTPSPSFLWTLTDKPKSGAIDASEKFLPYFADVKEDIPSYYKIEPKIYKNCQLMTETHGSYYQFYDKVSDSVLRIAINSHTYKPVDREKWAEGGAFAESSWKKLFSHPERFMKYDGQFFYPPRVEHKLQPTSLDKFDTGEYVGEPKFNGSSTSVAISEDGAVAKERHNTFFAIPPKVNFSALHRGKGYMCLTGEFMNKSKKDHTGKPFGGFVIWDILAFDGQMLIGSTVEERVNLLNVLYPIQSTSIDGSMHVISEGMLYAYAYTTDVPDIYRAANYFFDFHKIYDILSKVDAIEGWVLKRKNGKLELGTREMNNTGWSAKCRKPTRNYEF